MREIYFRGKRADNGEWVYSGTLIHLDANTENETYFMPMRGDTSLCVHDENYNINQVLYAMYYNIIPETVGQYTGLTDKNGKKIFEGDILHFKAYQGGGFACPIGTDIYYRVLFGHCNPDMDTLTEYVGFWALGGNYDEDDLYECGSSISYLVNSHGACVIGNIHDNPELLGGDPK